MSRYFLIAGFLVFAAGCSRTPYKVTDRTSEGAGGLTTRIKVEVPDSVTTTELQSYCDSILAGEAEPKLTVVEFFSQVGALQRKGACIAGKLYEGDSRVEIR